MGPFHFRFEDMNVLIVLLVFISLFSFSHLSVPFPHSEIPALVIYKMKGLRK